MQHREAFISLLLYLFPECYFRFLWWERKIPRLLSIFRINWQSHTRVHSQTYTKAQITMHFYSLMNILSFFLSLRSPNYVEGLLICYVINHIFLQEFGGHMHSFYFVNRLLFNLILFYLLGLKKWGEVITIFSSQLQSLDVTKKKGESGAKLPPYQQLKI